MGRLIVIAVDASIHAQYAVEWAFSNLTREGDSVILFHAYTEISGLDSEDTGTVNEADYAEQLRKWLTKSKIPAGVKLSVQLQKNASAGDAICSFLNSVHAEQVVVGTRGRSAMARWVLGSVADYLVANCSMPVTVVRTPQDYIAQNGNAAAAHMLREQDFHAVSSSVFRD